MKDFKDKEFLTSLAINFVITFIASFLAISLAFNLRDSRRMHPPVFMPPQPPAPIPAPRISTEQVNRIPADVKKFLSPAARPMPPQSPMR